MAHFAKLDDQSIVIDVNVVNNETVDNSPFPESETVGVAFLTDWSVGIPTGSKPHIMAISVRTTLELATHMMPCLTRLSPQSHTLVGC